MRERPQVSSTSIFRCSTSTRRTLARMRLPRRTWSSWSAGSAGHARPGAAPTFIVGFPGETEAEFVPSATALQRLQFDRVGVCSPTPTRRARARRSSSPRRSAKAHDQDCAASAEADVNEPPPAAVPLACNIRVESSGQELDVLVEGQAESDGPGGSVGRSYRDAPEVDGVVLVIAGAAHPPGGGGSASAWSERWSTT